MSQTSEQRNVAVREHLHELIPYLKVNLDVARDHGDKLQIDLAEAALNDALEQLSQVTND